MSRRPPLAVMGAGWVGLVTAACFAELGHDVTVRDVDSERIAALSRGVVPVHEHGLAELIERHSDRIHFTLDSGEAFRRAAAVFVCVGTPPTASGDANLSAVWRLVDELSDLEPPSILVMKSTVPIGTGERVRAELERRGLPVGYVSNPEFLAEGTALRDFRHPSRIVIGSFAERDRVEVMRLYDGMPGRILLTDVASAEMIKYASNAFLATKISFINEIANVCEHTGADVEVVAEGMGLDERIGPHFLRAGLGYGGSCFPKDVAALKQLAGESGYHFQLLNAVIEVNELQKRRVLTKLRRHLGELDGRRIALLGVAFKPNTNDVREAASLVLAARLTAAGAEVRVWDPVALEDAAPLLPPAVERCETVAAAVDGADAAVIVTEWDELRSLPLAGLRSLMRTPLIVDGRNVLNPDEARRAGLAYESTGRPTKVNGLEAAVGAETRPSPPLTTDKHPSRPLTAVAQPAR
jgi:UDPglucose 6-dehydrogenase